MGVAVSHLGRGSSSHYNRNVAEDRLAEKSMMATVVDHEVIQLDDVSLAEDSGWRELDGGRVDELVAFVFGWALGRDVFGRPKLGRSGRPEAAFS